MLESEEFARVLHMERERLDLFIAHGWVTPLIVDGRPMFQDVDLARAALIIDLTDDLGINKEGVDVVLNLLDQLYGLRIALAELFDLLESRKGSNDVRPSDTQRRGKSPSIR